MILSGQKYASNGMKQQMWVIFQSFQEPIIKYITFAPININVKECCINTSSLTLTASIHSFFCRRVQGVTGSQWRRGTHKGDGGVLRKKVNYNLELDWLNMNSNNPNKTH